MCVIKVAYTIGHLQDGIKMQNFLGFRNVGTTVSDNNRLKRSCHENWAKITLEPSCTKKKVLSIIVLPPIISVALGLDYVMNSQQHTAVCGRWTLTWWKENVVCLFIHWRVHTAFHMVHSNPCGLTRLYFLCAPFLVFKNGESERMKVCKIWRTLYSGLALMR